jgi:16S rRNA (guanine527-N7)-methyltransferase
VKEGYLKMNKEEFIDSLKELNINLDDSKLNQLDLYYHLIIEWNNKINLTAITDEKQVYLKHFYDSLTLIKEIDLNKNLKICDIGTGAGFPGIVLKIVFPKLNITLVDALNKRIKFLNIVIEKLDLKNIETIHARMEEYSKNNREKFDIVTARAVAPLSELLEIGAPALKVGGKLVFMKGTLKDEELNVTNAMKVLKLENMNKNEFLLPIENSTRTIISFTKKDITSKKYPRQYSNIKNNKL